MNFNIVFGVLIMALGQYLIEYDHLQLAYDS